MLNPCGSVTAKPLDQPNPCPLMFPPSIYAGYQVFSLSLQAEQIQKRLRMKFLYPYLTILVFALTASANASAKKQADKKQDAPVYMFGCGTSFTDSTTYVTAIYAVDGAEISQKTKFLEHRADYSNQLKTFLEVMHSPNQTCSIFYATKRKQLEKKYQKLRRHLLKKKDINVVMLPAEDFKFSGYKQ